jgi:hypothetical protein
MKMTSYLLRICCLGLALAVFLSGPTDGTRVGQEGDLWLKMSPEVREIYSAAYIRGFIGGYERGCVEGTRNVKSPLPGLDNDPLHKCLEQALQLTDTNKIAETVTAFYIRYASDRYLYIRDIINALGEGMTVEQIHSHASPAGVKARGTP